MNTLPIYYEAKLVANVSFDSHGFPELEYSESWQRSGSVCPFGSTCPPENNPGNRAH